MSEDRAVRRWHVAAVLVAAVLVAAPTPGDIGGCGQRAQPLDARVFFASKATIDCMRCQDCGLATSLCAEACDPYASIPEGFPQGCVPLVHDGEVCLRALHNASCGDYRDYVSDDPSVRSTPTECNFCPPR